MARNLQLQVILDAVDRATAPFRQVTSASAGAGQALRETRDHLKKLQASQKDLGSFKDLSRSSSNTARALEDQQRKVRELTSEINTTEGSTKRLVQQRASAIKQAKKLKDQYGAEQQKLQSLRNSIRNVEGVSGSLSQRQRQLSNRIEATNLRLLNQKKALDLLGKADVSGRFSKMTTEVGRLGRGIAMLGAAGGGGIAAIGHSFASSVAEMDQWAGRLGIPIEELSRWQHAGRQFGVQSDAMIDAFKELSLRTDEFATTGKGSAAEAFDRLGLSRSELAEASGDTGRLMEIVLKRVQELDNVAARQRIVDELFGGSGGEQMAEMASMSAEELARLRQEADDLGITLTKQSGASARQYMQSWWRVTSALEGVRNTIGVELMPVLTQSFNDLTGYLASNKTEVRAFAQAFGEKLRAALPIIVDVSKGVGTLLRKLAEITGTVARVVGGFDNLAIILAVLFSLKAITSVLMFAAAIGKVVKVFYTLAKTLPLAAGAAKLFGITLMGTPIGWILGGIALLAGAAYLIYRNWAGISNWFAQLWQGVKDSVGSAVDFFTGLPEQFRSFGSAMIDGLIGGILGKATALRDAVTGAAGKAVTGFKNLLGINSPSKVFAEFGVNTMEGYQQGIQRSEAKPLQEITGIAKRLQQAGAGLILGTLSTFAGALPSSVGVDMPSLGSVPLDTREPLSPGTGSRGVVIEGGIHISVSPQPGMNEQALARHIASEVQRALADAQHQAAVRQRSALYDND